MPSPYRMNRLRAQWRCHSRCTKERDAPPQKRPHVQSYDCRRSTNSLAPGPARYAERIIATNRAGPMALSLPLHQRTGCSSAKATPRTILRLPPQYEQFGSGPCPVRRADHSDQSSGPNGVVTPAAPKNGMLLRKSDPTYNLTTAAAVRTVWLRALPGTPSGS